MSSSQKPPMSPGPRKSLRMTNVSTSPIPSNNPPSMTTPRQSSLGSAASADSPRSAGSTSASNKRKSSQRPSSAKDLSREVLRKSVSLKKKSPTLSPATSSASAATTAHAAPSPPPALTIPSATIPEDSTQIAVNPITSPLSARSSLPPASTTTNTTTIAPGSPHTPKPSVPQTPSHRAPANADAYTQHMLATIKELQLKNQQLAADNAEKQESIYLLGEKLKQQEEAKKKHIRLYTALLSNLMANFFVKSYKTKQMLFRMQDMLFTLIPPILREYELNPSMTTTFDSNSFHQKQASKSTYQGSLVGVSTGPGKFASPKHPGDQAQRRQVLAQFAEKRKHEEQDKTEFMTDKQKEDLKQEQALRELYASTASGETNSAAAPSSIPSSARGLHEPSNLSVTVTPAPMSVPPSVPVSARRAPSPPGDDLSSLNNATGDSLAVPAGATGTSTTTGNPSHPPSARKKNKDTAPAPQEDLTAPHLQMEITIDDINRIGRFRKVKRGARVMKTPLIDLGNYVEEMFSIMQQSVINLLARLPQARVESENLAQRNIQLTERLLEIESRIDDEVSSNQSLQAQVDDLTTQNARLQNTIQVLKTDFNNALKHISSGSIRSGRETRIQNVASMYVSKAEPLPLRKSRSPSASPSRGRSAQTTMRSGAGSAARAVEHLRSVQQPNFDDDSEDQGQQQQEQPEQEVDQVPTHDDASVANDAASFNADDGAETDFLFDRGSDAPPQHLLSSATLSDFKEEYNNEEKEVYASAVKLKQEQDLERNFNTILEKRNDHSSEELRAVKQGRSVQVSHRSSQPSQRVSAAPSARVNEVSQQQQYEDPSDASIGDFRANSSSLRRPRPHSALYGSEMIQRGQQQQQQYQQLQEEEEQHGSDHSPVRSMQRGRSAHSSSQKQFYTQPNDVFSTQPRFTPKEVKPSLRELSPGRPTSSFTSNKKFDTGDIGGTNLYLGASSGSYDRNGFSPDIMKSRGKDMAFNSYGYADGRNMVSLPGASYAARREKDRALQSIANRTGVSHGPSQSLVSPTGAARRSSATTDRNDHRSPDRDSYSRERSRERRSSSRKDMDLRPATSAGLPARRREEEQNSVIAKIEPYHQRVLASPLNNSRSVKARPSTSSGTSSASKVKMSNVQRERINHIRSNSHALQAPNAGEFSPSQAIADALRDDESNQEQPTEEAERGTSLQEQNAATRRAIQYVYDPRDDAEQKQLDKLRRNDLVRAVNASSSNADDELDGLNPSPTFSTGQPFPVVSAASEAEYEDSVEIAAGNRHKKQQQPDPEERLAYATVNGKITKVSDHPSASATVTPAKSSSAQSQREEKKSSSRVRIGVSTTPTSATAVKKPTVSGSASSSSSRKKSPSKPSSKTSSAASVTSPAPAASEAPASVPVPEATSSARTGSAELNQSRAAALANILSNPTDFDSYVREIEAGVEKSEDPRTPISPVAPTTVDEASDADREPVWKSFPKFQLEKIDEARRKARLANMIHRPDAIGYRLLCRACTAENEINAAKCKSCSFPCVAEDVEPILLTNQSSTPAASPQPQPESAATQQQKEEQLKQKAIEQARLIREEEARAAATTAAAEAAKKAAIPVKRMPSRVDPVIPASTSTTSSSASAIPPAVAAAPAPAATEASTEPQSNANAEAEAQALADANAAEAEVALEAQAQAAAKAEAKKAEETQAADAKAAADVKAATAPVAGQAQVAPEHVDKDKAATDSNSAEGQAAADAKAQVEKAAADQAAEDARIADMAARQIERKKAKAAAAKAKADQEAKAKAEADAKVASASAPTTVVAAPSVSVATPAPVIPDWPAVTPVPSPNPVASAEPQKNLVRNLSAASDGSGVVSQSSRALEAAEGEDVVHPLPTEESIATARTAESPEPEEIRPIPGFQFALPTTAPALVQENAPAESSDGENAAEASPAPSTNEYDDDFQEAAALSARDAKPENSVGTATSSADVGSAEDASVAVKTSNLKASDRFKKFKSNKAAANANA